MVRETMSVRQIRGGTRSRHAKIPGNLKAHTLTNVQLPEKIVRIARKNGKRRWDAGRRLAAMATNLLDVVGVEPPGGEGTQIPE